MKLRFIFAVLLLHSGLGFADDTFRATGTWKGMMTTSSGSVPLQLDIADLHDIMAVKVGDTLSFGVNSEGQNVDTGDFHINFSDLLIPDEKETCYTTVLLSVGTPGFVRIVHWYQDSKLGWCSLSKEVAYGMVSRFGPTEFVRAPFDLYRDVDALTPSGDVGRPSLFSYYYQEKYLIVENWSGFFAGRVEKNTFIGTGLLPYYDGDHEGYMNYPGYPYRKIGFSGTFSEPPVTINLQVNASPHGNGVPQYYSMQIHSPSSP